MKEEFNAALLAYAADIAVARAEYDRLKHALEIRKRDEADAESLLRQLANEMDFIVPSSQSQAR